MRGSIRQRYANSYTLIIDIGSESVLDANHQPVIDPKTGRPTQKRRQKWVVFKPDAGTPKQEARKQAEAKLAELLNTVHKGTFVEPSKTTVIVAGLGGESGQAAVAPGGSVPGLQEHSRMPRG